LTKATTNIWGLTWGLTWGSKKPPVVMPHLVPLILSSQNTTNLFIMSIVQNIYLVAFSFSFDITVQDNILEEENFDKFYPIHQNFLVQLKKLISKI